MTRLFPAICRRWSPLSALLSNPYKARPATSIRRNVTLNVERLKTTAPILKSFVDEKKINVVGGIYQLKTGRVELLT